MGTDNLDAWFGYTTTKTVYIGDRWLGFIYYSLVVFVLLYIFLVQILLQNSQFKLSPVEGIARVKVTQPTQGVCDTSHPDCKSAYRSLQKLRYCSAYTGDRPLKHQAACKFLDALSIMPNGEVDNKIFIPTAIEVVTEKRSCRPGPENYYTCENEYEEIPGADCNNGKKQCGSRGGLKDQFYFVADMKNFQIQFTSSYEQGGVHGTSLDHPAFYEVCQHRLREANESHHWKERARHGANGEDRCDGGHVTYESIPCAPGQSCAQRRGFDFMHHTGARETIDATRDAIRGVLGHESRRKSTKFLGESRGHLGVESSDPSDLGIGTAPPASKGMVGNQWSSAYGDVFKLDRLMELAGADLDSNFNIDGWSTRESGTVLEVSAVYSNLHRFLSTFGYMDVDYFYRVRELPLPIVSRRALAAEQPADYPETRRYEIRHGIMIWFRVVGEFGNFSSTYLLIYLITALALIGAASTTTDFVAMYIHTRKNNYFNLKYEISSDFSEMWQCPKCQYWNSQIHDKCQSYPMWQNSEESPRCGTPMPDPHLLKIPSGNVRLRG